MKPVRLAPGPELPTVPTPFERDREAMERAADWLERRARDVANDAIVDACWRLLAEDDPAEWVGLLCDGLSLHEVHADCEDCFERLCADQARAWGACTRLILRREGAWIMQPWHA